MSNIEKIRQEIERRIKLYSITNEKEQWIVNTYWSVLSFIDSLPEEKPSEDLENTAHHIAIETLNDTKFMTTTMGYVLGKLQDIFIAGAEWQKEQDTREMVMSDGSYFQKCYELGKKDMRVEMMKEAVNAEITVGRLSDDWSLAYNPDELHRALLKFKSGDKVKIIIVKQDDRPRDRQVGGRTR